MLDAHDERRLLPTASLTKIVTALAVVHALSPTTEIPVSPHAEGMPARKINMKAGQLWTLKDTLHAMLLSSANDAAIALAERTSGSVEAFGAELQRAADDAGMEDHPVLRDPAGLDDEFSVGGGNLISARDLAIGTRALLAEPALAEAVATREYRFLGGDGIQHKLINHNRLLRTYDGTIGVKTGYTKKSGHGLIAAARRGNRTMIAVVVDAVDTYASATALLDKGFATPARAERGDRLPDPTARQLRARGEARGVTLFRAPQRQSPRHSTAPWTVGVASATTLAAAVLALRSRRRRRDVPSRRERRRRYAAARGGAGDRDLAVPGEVDARRVAERV